jgi:hypothetical protein
VLLAHLVWQYLLLESSSFQAPAAYVFPFSGSSLLIPDQSDTILYYTNRHQVSAFQARPMMADLTVPIGGSRVMQVDERQISTANI